MIANVIIRRKHVTEQLLPTRLCSCPNAEGLALALKAEPVWWASRDEPGQLLLATVGMGALGFVHESASKQILARWANHEGSLNALSCEIAWRVLWLWRTGRRQGRSASVINFHVPPVQKTGTYETLGSGFCLSNSETVRICDADPITVHARARRDASFMLVFDDKDKEFSLVLSAFSHVQVAPIDTQLGHTIQAKTMEMIKPQLALAWGKPGALLRIGAAATRKRPCKVYISQPTLEYFLPRKKKPDNQLGAFNSPWPGNPNDDRNGDGKATERSAGE
jgi:hypothetical protein